MWNQCSPPGITVRAAPLFSANSVMVRMSVSSSRSPYRMRVGTRLGALCANEPGGARSLRRRLQTGIEGPAAELLLRDPSVRTLRAVWQQGSVQVNAAGGCF